MKLRINPSIQNSDMTRKQVLKEVRKPIQDSLLTKAKKRLFKVKYVDNDILFNNPNDPDRNIGGHYTLTVGINPHAKDVAVVIITSLEDRNGNLIKQEQIEKGLIYPLENINGLSRRSGIKQEVITKNKFTNENVNYDSLQNLRNEIIIADSEREGIHKFLYSNPAHQRSSERNNRRTKKYIK